MEWKARTLSYGRGWAGRGERRDIDLKPKVSGQAQPGGMDAVTFCLRPKA